MRAIIADDHMLVRAGLKLVLQKIDSDMEVAEREDFNTALELAEELSASGSTLDLAILDFRMPGMDEGAGIETFCTRFSDTPVVVLSGHYRRPDVLECFRRGASGFIPKTLGTKAMMNAIQLVLAGGKYLPADILLEHIGNREPQSANSSLDEQDRLRLLSHREREVLAELARGLPNKMIAKNLDIQEVTVKSHLTRIYQILGVDNRVQAVKIALELN